jgi:hypothetical protein
LVKAVADGSFLGSDELGHLVGSADLEELAQVLALSPGVNRWDWNTKLKQFIKEKIA